MTTIAQLYTKIQLSVPLFSLIYYILSWCFIVCFSFFLVYHTYYKRSYQSQAIKGYSPLGQDDDDEQDEDLQMFLKMDNSALNERMAHDKQVNREGQCWDN
mmetsp:Transcript_5774/g.9195  ORF Transcript_5774/g.9195 Transcript_5774/m.9195 type:complete len:101 (+) Transcript_5774:2270-2572(+)